MRRRASRPELRSGRGVRRSADRLGDRGAEVEVRGTLLDEAEEVHELVVDRSVGVPAWSNTILKALTPVSRAITSPVWLYTVCLPGPENRIVTVPSPLSVTCRASWVYQPATVTNSPVSGLVQVSV